MARAETRCREQETVRTRELPTESCEVSPVQRSAGLKSEEPTSYICVSPLLTVARCWMETELVPRLEEVEECQQLPREVCTPRPRPPCPRPSVLLSVLSLLP